MNINLCGRPKGGCCPYVKEDKKNNVTYIVEGKTKIKFNEEQLDNLKKYLNRRN